MKSVKYFEESFYTNDFDQEMLDFIKVNYPFWENEDGYPFYPFTINTENTILRHSKQGDFIVTWVKEGEKLTKEQFKQKIGMTNTPSNTVDINMLKTGMIVEHRTAFHWVWCC